MPGVKPASTLEQGGPPTATAETTMVVGGMKTEEEVAPTMTAMILPDQVEDDEGTRTTTVVIEETPEGTIIQQSATAAVEALQQAHVKPVHLVEQQQVIQIQAADGQDISGIPYNILQDATTADGQKISIIKIATASPEDAAAVVHEGQPVFVSGGVTFTRQHVDSNSVEIVVTGDGEAEI